MTRAWEIWKLVRDIGLTITGISLLLLAGVGLAPPAAAPLLIPGAFAMLAAPYYLRKDERDGEKQ